MSTWSPVGMGGIRGPVADLDGWSVTRVVHPVSSSLPWHSHEHANLSLVTRGAFTESFRRRSETVHPGEILSKPPGEIHRNHYHSDVDCIVIELSAGQLEHLSAAERLFANSGHHRSPRIRHLCAEMLAELKDTDDVTPLALEALCLLTVAETARGSKRRKRTSRVQPWLIQAEEMLRSGGPPPSATRIARAVGVHPSHLARCFRERYRCSMGEYLRRLRFERAARALLDDSKSLAEVALESGFFDHSHMCRAFRRYAGISPGEYRRRR